MHNMPHFSAKLLLCTQIGVYMSRELRHTSIYVLCGINQVFAESLGNKIVTNMNIVNYSLERFSGSATEILSCNLAV